MEKVKPLQKDIFFKDPTRASFFALAMESSSHSLGVKGTFRYSKVPSLQILFWCCRFESKEEKILERDGLKFFIMGGGEQSAVTIGE